MPSGESSNVWKGRIEGVIFLATNICDLDLETVIWTRRWIAEVGDRPLAASKSRKRSAGRSTIVPLSRRGKQVNSRVHIQLHVLVESVSVVQPDGHRL